MLELPRGQINLFAEKPAINTSATPEEAAKIADYYNTADYLSKVFFQKNDSILSTELLESGGAVTMMKPSGGYTEGAIMVIAAGPESFSVPNTKTETIYDYPEDVQEAYWGNIIEGLEAFNEHIQDYPDAEKYHVFATENCMVTRTSPQTRTSRSIALPHAQVLLLNSDHVFPADKTERKIPHLIREQAALRDKRRLYDFSAKVQRHAYGMTGEFLNDVKIHNRPPMGYSFLATETGNIQEVREALSAHHNAYKAAAQEWVDNQPEDQRKSVIPQPSYRLYLTAENGVVRASNSPEFISHAGVMEAAGLKIDRGPNHPTRMTQEERDELHRKLIIRKKPSYSSYAAD